MYIGPNLQRQNRAMTSLRKIALSGACIVVLSGASIVWWVHREKAIEWKKLSDAASETRARAEQGDAGAQASFGHMYPHGQGVPQDYREAVRWYRKAAEQGDANGQDGLASMYYYGRGVLQDYAEALRWYRKAADQGDAEARNFASRAYAFATTIRGFSSVNGLLMGIAVALAIFLWVETIKRTRDKQGAG